MKGRGFACIVLVPEQYDQGLQCYINKRDDFIFTTSGNQERANRVKLNTY